MSVFLLAQPREKFLAPLVIRFGPHVVGGLVSSHRVRRARHVSLQLARISQKFTYLVVQVISYHARDDTRRLIVKFHVFRAYPADVGGHVRGYNSDEIGILFVIHKEDEFVMGSCGRLAAKYFSSVTCIGKLLMSSSDRFFL